MCLDLRYEYYWDKHRVQYAYIMFMLKGSQCIHYYNLGPTYIWVITELILMMPTPWFWQEGQKKLHKDNTIHDAEGHESEYILNFSLEVKQYR